MPIFEEIFTGLLGVWKEMFSFVWGILPKLISVGLWGISALIILPCVYISGVLYPKWVEWGEDL